MLKNYTKVKVDHYGNKYYFNDEEKYHRLDGPAVEDIDGSKFWYINGIRHQNIDPSSEWSDREKRWCFKGEYHRIGGSDSSYNNFWYIHGKVYNKQDYFNKVWEI